MTDSGAAAAAGGMVLLVMLFYIFGCMFAVGAFVFWIWMIVDVITKAPSRNDKVVWVFVVILLSWIGALIYFFVRKRKRKKLPVAPPPATA